MNNIAHEVKKHLSIYGFFIKSSMMQQMEYRLNFITYIAAETGFLLSKLIYVFIVYKTGINIKGMSPDEISLFIGTFLIMTGIYTGFFMDNFYAVPEMVRTGKLDMLITKPVSLQFFLTMRKVNPALPIPNVAAGIFMVVRAWKVLHIATDFYTVSAYLYTVICSVVFTYSVFLLPQLLSFRFVRMNAVQEITDRLWDFNNMPMNIYGKWLQRFGVFIIPVFAIVNFPPMTVLNIMPAAYKIWAGAGAILFFAITRFCFKKGLKSYSSAGG